MAASIARSAAAPRNIRRGLAARRTGNCSCRSLSSGITLQVVPESAVKAVATWPLVMEAVRRSFIAANDGSGHNFPVVFGHGTKEGTTFGAKSGLLSPGGEEEEEGAAAGLVGLTVGSCWPANRRSETGRPMRTASCGSLALLLDDETGFPHALVNAQFLNGMRTAAANAVAVEALAPAGASSLLVFGAGGQALFEAQAVCQVRPIERIAVVSRSRAPAEALAAALRAWLDEGGPAVGMASPATSVEVAAVAGGPPNLFSPWVGKAVSSADIVATATPNRLDRVDGRPLFDASYLLPTAHISAMGCDAPGKGELDLPGLLAAAEDSRTPVPVSFFADHPPQAAQVGEFQHLPLTEDVTALGAVLSGRAAPPTGGRTVFDSSGIALQDLACAEAVLDAAAAAGLVQAVDF